MKRSQAGRLWRGSFPTSQPHSRPSPADGENTPRQDIPLDWVRGVERLHRLPAHAGVPQHRWGVFLNDFDQFIHGRGGWAERAADLGWDTLALFGCHPTRPLDHLNGAGLLWRISGGKITAMQSDWATIEIDGVQRIIHRRPSPANFVLPWRRRAP